MTIPDTAVLQAAEDQRAFQTAGARAVEQLLRLPDLPPIAAWEISGSSGAVRGRLALPTWSRTAAIRAVRAAHRSRGGVVRLRNRLDGGRELAAHFQFRLWDVELWQFTREPDAITLGRDIRQLRTQLEKFAAYVDPLGWIKQDETTLRRHTPSGWWELSRSYGAAGEWRLFGPDGSPFGELMSSRKTLARERADQYIAERERP
ncbi:hypothetical protein [Streptomyces justiciae]|uniref:hypothetical protein n=1 Tax=Streptomyces justiciae TaxID=2780140 RepID=UPI0021180E70|nr:hypothetical protein [Streptomyces justiciae]MCW8383938.1 hypothetical protein [Streptomyces justiciae]